MNRTLIGFFLLVGIGSSVLIGVRIYKKIEERKTQALSSDAGQIKGQIRVGVDNWIGYFPLCSPQMKKLMRGAGYLMECADDQANYDERFLQLKKQKLQFAAATVDSYLLNAKSHGYPGTIVAVLDESKGGDAIVAYKSKVANLDALKRLQDVKIGFTPASPSEHLLRSISAHFDIPMLREPGKWRVETAGSSDALKKFQKKEVDVAVLWEPDVSKALENHDVVKLLGTEDTQKLIVDILVVEREFSREKPEAVKALLSNYFRTLKHYKGNPDILKEDVKRNWDVPSSQVDAVLQAVQWANLYDNASRWFGLNASDAQNEEGVIDTLQATSRILMETGAVSEDPIPDGNPYGLQNKSFIEGLFTHGLTVGFGDGSAADKGEAEPASRSFSSLSAEQWQRLKEVGTFRIRPITFQSGTSRLDSSGESQLKEAAQALDHYPNFRVVIAGHTGTQGDPKANASLSEARSKAVKDYLVSQLGIDADRLFSAGYGAEKPLPRHPDESQRAYQYRLPRVELKLVTEVY